MVDNAKGIYEVVFLDRHHSRKGFRVAYVESGSQAINFETLSAELETLLRKFDSSELGACTSEVDGVRPDTATDLENLLPFPPRKICKAWNVVLDKVLSFFYLIKIRPCADRLGRMAEVAGTAIPEVLYISYGRLHDSKIILDIHKICYDTPHMKLFGLLATRLFMNRAHPRYSKNLFKFCSRYVDFCYGDNDFDRRTNGEYRLLKEIIPRAKVVFDVGANIGDYAEEILHIKKDVLIHAFEPDSRAFGELSKKGVRANNCALGKTVGEAVLHLHKNKSVFNSLLDLHGEAELLENKKVKVDTIDNYADSKNITHIDFMKIDVEGYEFFVLEGARGMFQKKAIDLIQFEFSGATAQAGVFLKDFIDFFVSYGYTLYRIKPLSTEKVIYYPDQERFTLTNYLAVKDGLPIDHLKISKSFYH